MSYTVLVENEANKDLQSIFKYISKNDSSVKAKKFILELSKKIESLNSIPYRCRGSYYSDDTNTRDLIYKGYTIVFKIINKNVHILTIFRQHSF